MGSNMKIFGIISLLSAFLVVDANRQCRNEMNTLFGAAERKAHHQKWKVICAKNKGFLDDCEKRGRFKKRCNAARDLLTEILPKFEELEGSMCLKLAAKVCKRPESVETKNDKAEVKEDKEEKGEVKEDKEDKGKKDEKKKNEKRPENKEQKDKKSKESWKQKAKQRFEQKFAQAKKMCEEKNKCHFYEKLKKIKAKFEAMQAAKE